MGRLACLIAVCATACIGNDLVPCGEQLCPAGDVCSPAGCVVQDQIDACDGLADGTPCTPTTSAPGTCRDGVCVQFCGDGVVEATEQCDDGNTNPADGCDACRLTRWQASAVIGGNANANAIALENPSGIALDRAGNLYIADTYGYVIRRVDTSGHATIVAGNGTRGFSGDGGPATSAQLYNPSDVAVDGLGNVYIADTNNGRIRVVDGNGTITTVAGGGSTFGDGGPARNAQLSEPTGIAIDGVGTIYIADLGNLRVRRVDVNGTITTVAGTGTSGTTGDNGPATSAELTLPCAVALDGGGNLYISDRDAGRIRKVTPAGTITTFAGIGTFGFGGDGGPATSASLYEPGGMELDAAGNLYFADEYNMRIRRIDPAGIITTVAGGGTTGPGDGGLATSAGLNHPQDVKLGPDGTLWIADTTGYRVRHVDASGTIFTVAGNGQEVESGDGSAPTSLALSLPAHLTFDAAGNLYIVDGNAARIRKLDTTGMISTIAGTGIAGFSGDGGPATAAQLSFPQAIAFDAAGNAYITDDQNSRIRKIDTAGTITTFAGTGTFGFGGDGGPATSALLAFPEGIALDPAGNVYVSELGNHRIRKIDTAGTITTIAGTGMHGFTGDNGPATSAELAFPGDVLVDSQGNILIADTQNGRIRKINAAGTITTIAGNGGTTLGDGGPATSAQIAPSAITLDAQGQIYIADGGTGRARKIGTNGIITTVAGNTMSEFAGDGGPAISASLWGPVGIAVDASGRVFVAESYNQDVRVVDASGTITTIVGLVDPPGMGPLAQASLAAPRALAVAPPFTFVAGGVTGTLQAITATSVEVVAGRYPQPAAIGALARFRDNTFGTMSGVAYDADANTIYVTESSANRVHAITIVDPANVDTWTIAALANAAGTAGFADGTAATARFRSPTGLTFDPATHTLYVADTGNHAIRAIALGGGAAAATVTTVFGTGATLGFDGDGGPASAALLYGPQALARCANGDFFIADTGNNRVRRVDGTGTITTVLGDGVAASSGEGGPATTFPVNAPLGVGCDPIGNIYVTSTTTVRQLAADDNGVVDGTGTVRTIYGASPRTDFPASVTTCLTGIAVIDANTVQIADACTGILVGLTRP